MGGYGAPYLESMEFEPGGRYLTNAHICLPDPEMTGGRAIVSQIDKQKTMVNRTKSPDISITL